MSDKTREFYQDAEPTPTAIGDRWITPGGVIRTCYQRAPNSVLWAFSSGGGVRIEALIQTATRAQFTDGGATVGTFTLPGVVPAGAVLLPMKMLVALGFTGDTSAVITIGDGSDVDRYMNGTPSVFTTAATGVEVGATSGARLIVTANSPVLTITSAADFTNVVAGSVTVSIPYVLTV